MREERTDVLVVGAGPVGLWTALLLAEAGLAVSIVDRERRTTVRSYACALHPRTLNLLQRAGLAQSLLPQGRRVSVIGFYDGESRRAELDLGCVGGEFPFLLILPQNRLEEALEQKLRQAGVAVHWNHRFDAFAQQEEGVNVTVEELAGTSTGYIVPHWETVVKNRAELRTQFLVGADGHQSLVRERLGISSMPTAEPQSFAAYEFECEGGDEGEVRVVLDENTTNVLWPLPEGKCRWTFQLVRGELGREFPEKERRAVHVQQAEVDERLRRYVQQVSHRRAPWFTKAIKQVTWCTEVAFQPSLVADFGRHRCWLAGDAAHQTGPVGVQSMNLGFWEADLLAGKLQRVLRQEAPLGSLAGPARDAREEWRRLLGLTGGLRPRSDTLPWVRERNARLLSCLPASGADVDRLADQLKLDLK